MRLKLIIILTLAAALSGCFGGLDQDLARYQDQENNARSEETVTVARPTVLQSLASGEVTTTLTALPDGRYELQWVSSLASESCVESYAKIQISSIFRTIDQHFIAGRIIDFRNLPCSESGVNILARRLLVPTRADITVPRMSVVLSDEALNTYGGHYAYSASFEGFGEISAIIIQDADRLGEVQGFEVRLVTSGRTIVAYYRKR